LDASAAAAFTAVSVSAAFDGRAGAPSWAALSWSARTTAAVTQNSESTASNLTKVNLGIVFSWIG
jgi:hypothetical protein